jgi:transcriptional antiterminator RfaH
MTKTKSPAPEPPANLQSMQLTTPVAVPPSWYCVRAQAKREHVAARNLRERVEIEVFAPRIQGTYNTRRGLTLNSTEALFPGYLFARFAYPDQVRHVMSTCGVTGIVAFGAQPPAIADPVIEYLRREVALAEQSPTAPVLAEGSWVRILSGCFQYIEGRVLHFDPRTDRVRLLLTLLGSEVQVSVSAERIALLSEARPLYPSSLLTQQAAVLHAR